MRFTIDRIDHVVLNVKDVEISAAWYQRVLGMEREDFGPDNRTALKFGGQKLNLRPTNADKHRWIAATDTAPGTADLCFITENSIADVLEYLASMRVHVEEGPVERLGALGKMQSVYIRDPDRNLIEIANQVG